MDGFCAVTLLETVTRDPHDRAAWKKGNPKFGAIHRGRTYLFTSPEHQQKFLANPDAYAPVLSGCDPVVFAERGELLDGKRAYGLITPDKRIYLFADEAALRKFNQSPAPYAAAAQQATLRTDGSHVYR
jgi:YHS domain-containing protein